MVTTIMITKIMTETREKSDCDHHEDDDVSIQLRHPRF